METSGCLLVAKTEEVRDALIRDFSARRVHKEYLAIVVGEVEWKKNTVDAPLKYVRAEDPEAPKPSLRPWERPVVRAKRKGPPVMRGLKKGVVTDADDERGKASLTHFQVVSRFRGYTLVRAEPKTGRTHQIRVHVSSTGHPLAYDPLYGRRSPLRMREFDLSTSETDAGEAVVLNRLPLHAWKLGFMHPVTKQFQRVQADLPRDLKDFIRILKRFRRQEEEEER
jgi:23S rRNA pseudouridine1911/1915/1917 synthase